MRLLFADDHDLVRETLCAFLDTQENFKVWQAANFPDAKALIKSESGFDVILLDFSMPGMNGLAGLEEAIELNQGAPVAIISGTANKQIAEKALAAGAAGFLPKTITPKSLINAVNFMAMGEIYAPVEFMTAEDEEADDGGLLTNRERQVLKGIAEGKSNKEIARDIDLQEVTIKLHVKTLSRKLQAKNRTHAAMIARDQNLI